ncbi:glycosyltransferase family 2 protein [Rufibacter sp. XAAS-G3-1]|uniref:glycosyltransferase family 2 protein n=1 Tax=Rufibacter sp. XAAS-G3-1 TaxID=2729134 RepID=UPI0015E765C3|nr:glycosyltransferase family 2 protein [Rufibacter sp. XAAS-G3-1]
MKVSGFTFIKNAIKYDYPILESISSILPLCDEVVVAVGKSEDNTLELIRGIDSPKIRIIETEWDTSLRKGGQVLALETDKAFAAISPDADWAFYIQGDEVVHDQYYPNIREAMLKYKDSPALDGLLFKYKHFYGSYEYLGESTRWYRHEIRVIRNHHGIYSYQDAQGFRKGKNQKLQVKPIDAYVYHYGYVKEPKAMQRKQENFGKLWHSDEYMDQIIVKAEEFDYAGIDALKLFEGSHPTVMTERVRQKNWKFTHDISKKRLELKDRFKLFVERLTGYRIGEYKNYKIAPDS